MQMIGDGIESFPDGKKTDRVEDSNRENFNLDPDKVSYDYQIQHSNWSVFFKV